MKKVILALAITLSLSNIYCQNLLTNGDFESGQQPWNSFASEGAKANFSIENNGSNALKIDVQTLGTNAWDIQSLQSFASELGKQYTLTLRAKAKKSGSKIRVQVQKTTYTSTDIELTTDWKDYSWNFEAKEDNLELAFHYFQKDLFYLDDISITKASKKGSKGGAPAAGNLVPNGNLEKGDEGWVNLADNGAKAIYSINEDSPYEGKKSLRTVVMSFGPNTWDIQSINNFASVKGQRYKLTFVAKASNPGKKIKAQIQHNDKKIYIPKDYVLTDKWQEYSWVFSAQASDMQIAFQYLDSGLYEMDALSIVAMSKKKKKKKKKKKRN